MDKKEIIIIFSIAAACELLIFSILKADRRRKMHNMICVIDKDSIHNYCPHLRHLEKRVECLEDRDQEKVIEKAKNK